MYRKAYFIGSGAYLIMLLLSMVFYKERTIFLDAAFNLFYIIKKGTFCIQSNRFGDFFSQLLPVITSRLGLSLNTVLRSYSTSFVIYYFSCYFICGSILKRYDIALCVLLLNLLFVSHTFYFTLSPLPQAIALLLVIMSMVLNKRVEDISFVSWVILLAAIATVVFFHPLVVFVLGYSVVFFLLQNNSSQAKKLLYFLVGAYCAGMAVKFMFFRIAYEQHSMSGMKNFVTQFPDYFTLFSNGRFARNCVTKYYWIPVLFSGIAVFYYHEGNFRKLRGFIACVVGYLMLVNISYPTAATPEFYIENLYLPLAIFLALPLVFDVLPWLDKRRMALPLIALIILTGLSRIYASHNLYTERLNYERKIVARYAGKKAIMQASSVDTSALLMLWGAPYEFLILSVSDGGQPASLLINEDPAKLGWARERTQSIIVNWDVIPYKELPKRYFNFPDTISGYSIILE